MEQKKYVISPSGLSYLSKIKEIFEYRELLWMLAWRDFKVKYAQSLLGFAWAIIDPVFTLIILTFIFGTVAKVDTSGIPHPIYTLAGLCGWVFFSSLANDAGRSILGAQNMIKKIYFPRLILPLSKIFTSLIDLSIVLICMIILMIFYQYAPGSNILWLPFFIMIAILAGIVVGIWISALTIRYRDFKHILPLGLRLGMYATPIAYPASAVPDKYQFFFFLNPMAGVVEGVRWSLVGTGDFPIYIFGSLTLLLILLIWGLIYFNQMEKVMADII